MKITITLFLSLALTIHAAADEIRGKCDEPPPAPVNSPNPVFEVDQRFINIHKHATGEVSIGNCTATLIGPDLVMTAAYCARRRAYNNIKFHNEDGSPLDKKSFRVHSLLVQLGPGAHGDAAIYSLKESAGDIFGWREIEFSYPQTDDSVTIFQHPNGSKKRYCGGFVTGMIREDGHSDFNHGGFIQHSCSSCERSAGSGVLDSKGRLIAIHTNGLNRTPVREGNYGYSLKKLSDIYSRIHDLIPPRLALHGGERVMLESGADPGLFLSAELKLVSRPDAATWTVKRFDNGTIGLYSDGGGWLTWAGESGTPRITPQDEPSGIGFMWLGLRKRNDRVYLRTSPKGYPRWLEPREGGTEAYSAEKATHGWVFHPPVR